MFQKNKTQETTENVSVGLQYPGVVLHTVIHFQSLNADDGAKRRNLFPQNNKQETTEREVVEKKIRTLEAVLFVLCLVSERVLAEDGDDWVWLKLRAGSRWVDTLLEVGGSCLRSAAEHGDRRQVASLLHTLRSSARVLTTSDPIPQERMRRLRRLMSDAQNFLSGKTGNIWLDPIQRDRRALDEITLKNMVNKVDRISREVETASVYKLVILALVVTFSGVALAFSLVRRRDEFNRGREFSPQVLLSGGETVNAVRYYGGVKLRLGADSEASFRGIDVAGSCVEQLIFLDKRHISEWRSQTFGTPTSADKRHPGLMYLGKAYRRFPGQVTKESLEEFKPILDSLTATLESLESWASLMKCESDEGEQPGFESIGVETEESNQNGVAFAGGRQQSKSINELINTNSNVPIALCFPIGEFHYDDDLTGVTTFVNCDNSTSSSESV
ncbi:hypothetical protein AAG570_011246 [Ranatra chinensis]|uniref:Uncharacterized protein n=1 Tax=Ranatra chinensis TaxID=642074 RepID=A0ABD0Z6B9_9HEMI